MAGGFKDAMAGGGAGAAIGSIVPGIGTLTGGLLGGLGGLIFGSSSADEAKEKAFRAAQARYAQLLPMMQGALGQQQQQQAAMFGPMNEMLMGMGSSPVPLPTGNPFGNTVGINQQGNITGGSAPVGVPNQLGVPKRVPRAW